MSKAFADSTYSGGSSSSCSILTLPAFRSRFSWARADADLVRPPERPHPLLSGPLWDGGRMSVSTEAGAIGGGDYIRAAARRKGVRRVFGEIRFDLKLRSRRRGRDRGRRRVGAPRRRSSSASSSARIRSAGERIPEARGADRDRGRPAARNASASAPALDPAHPDHRDRDRGGDPAHLLERDRPGPPGPRARRCRRRATARAACGSSACALSVLISETASRRRPPAAAATAAGSAQFGRQLHDQRRVGERPNRLEQGEGLGRAARRRSAPTRRSGRRR